jgi:hypothetical protein
VDGFDIQAGDPREKHITTVTHLFGLQGYAPAPLLLIQATEKQVHLVMQRPLHVLLGSATLCSLTVMDFYGHTVYHLILRGLQILHLNCHPFFKTRNYCFTI